MVLAANGVWIWTIVAIIVWIAIAFWPARVAARKGHSFFLYFLFSLVFFPAALIVAYLVRDRTKDRMSANDEVSPTGALVAAMAEAEADGRTVTARTEDQRETA